jgi:ABC-type phosphate/phosphonate transport system substrate-binding protein
MVLAGLILAGCGGQATPERTPLPTATATPRSTPLPVVATEVPLASTDRPLTVLMLPHDPEDVASDAADDLAAQITDLAGLAVDVELVNSYGEIVARLCSADPVAGWVDGVAYLVAATQGCADPALLVERDGDTGYEVDLLIATDITGNEVSEDDISALAGETLCRLSDQDDITWFVPSLMLYAAGINPLYDLDAVIDVEDYDALVAAIYAGECQAGAVPSGYFPRQLDVELRSQEDLTDEVAVLRSSPTMAYDILVYPQTVPLNVRIPLTDVFFQIAASRTEARVLTDILGQDGVERVDAGDFDNLRAFVAASGLDLAAMGD